jgi:hypothetical protein
MKLLTLLGGFAALVISAVYSGYVYSWIWLWFVVPFGLPVISVPMAIGLRMLIGQIPPYTEDEPEDKNFVAPLVYGLAMVTMVWGISWVAHLYL